MHLFHSCLTQFKKWCYLLSSAWKYLFCYYYYYFFYGRDKNLKCLAAFSLELEVTKGWNQAGLPFRGSAFLHQVCVVFFLSPSPRFCVPGELAIQQTARGAAWGYLKSELIPRQWLAGQVPNAVLLACRRPAKILRGKSNERCRLERMRLQQSRGASGSQIWTLTPCELKLRAWGRPPEWG